MDECSKLRMFPQIVVLVVLVVLGFVCVNLRDLRENKSALADCTGYIQKEQNAF